MMQVKNAYKICMMQLKYVYDLHMSVTITYLWNNYVEYSTKKNAYNLNILVKLHIYSN